MPNEHPASRRPTASSGRDVEVARLLAELADVQRLGSAPRVVFVRGGEGIGKSFLLGLFRREATSRAVRCFEGRAERGGRRPYALFGEIVPEMISSLEEQGVPQRDLAALARRTAPLCGRAVRTGTTNAATHEERRLDLFDAVAEVVALAGRNLPPVVLLDDVDGADAASLELLRYVLATLTAPGQGAAAADVAGGTRSLWVVAFRDDSMPEALDDLVARTPAAAMPLEGLDLDGLRALLQSPEMVERILDSTGGVPERVEALLTTAGTEPVRELFVARLDRLPHAQRVLVELLAVIGEGAEVALLEHALARLDEAVDVPATLDALCAARLAVGRFGARVPRYSLARDAERARVIRALSDEASARLHGAVGASLAELPGADPAAVARHLLVSAPETEGFDWAVKAGDALLARLAYREAAAAWEQALAVLSDSRSSQAGALFQRLAQLHFGTAEYARALGWLGRYKGTVREQPAEVRRVRAQAARVCLKMGRPALAEKLCRRVLETVVEGSADPVELRVAADLAEAAWNQGHYEQAVDLARRGLEALAGQADDALAREELELRNTLGKIHLHRADYSLARACFEENAELARARGLGRDQAKALNNQGVVAQRQGDRRRALACYRASLDLRQGSADRSREAFALQNIAALYHETGEFEKALDHYHRALASFTRAGNAAQVTRTACNLANLYVFLGDAERAESLSSHALAMAGEVADPYLVSYAHMVRGDLCRLREERSEARSEYRAALEGFLAITSPRYALEVRLSLAELLLDEGDLRSAREVLDEVGETLADQHFAGLAGPHQVLVGEVALASDDLDRATRALSRAKELLLDAPELEWPVRLYHALARLRTALGDESGAEVNLSRAQRLLDELVAGVPVSHRTLFLAHGRRRALLDAVAGREITPARMRDALRLETAAPAAEPAAPTRFVGVVGADPTLLRVLERAERVAAVETPVLVRGESGTGKELVADAIHRRSARKDAPLVKVNCAAMHEELLLSELFGHEKGAFTGASRERKGRFELADGGTLFLDEIGDISPKAQVALLRVLQNGEFERVGGTQTLRVDVRLICATNRDLEGMMARGAFREDLYYRLKGAMLELPPLRERQGDLPALVEHFLQKVAGDRGEPAKKVSPQVMAALAAHRWPGNIREMENVVQSLALFSAGPVVEYADLEHHPELLGTEGVPGPAAPPTAAAAPAPAGPTDFFELAQNSGMSLKDLKREVELQCIRRALDTAGGNISEAARLLGMKRSRLSQIVNSDEDLKALTRSR